MNHQSSSHRLKSQGCCFGQQQLTFKQAFCLLVVPHRPGSLFLLNSAIQQRADESQMPVWSHLVPSVPSLSRPPLKSFSTYSIRGKSDSGRPVFQKFFLTEKAVRCCLSAASGRGGGGGGGVQTRPGSLRAGAAWLEVCPVYPPHAETVGDERISASRTHLR